MIASTGQFEGVCAIINDNGRHSMSSCRGASFEGGLRITIIIIYTRSESDKPLHGEGKGPRLSREDYWYMLSNL